MTLAIKDINLSSSQKKNLENTGLNGFRTHDLCDTGAAL